ncbi:MAG: hypothetical protein R6X02_01690 [Enhygromyxa sp.]
MDESDQVGDQLSHNPPARIFLDSAGLALRLGRAGRARASTEPERVDFDQLRGDDGFMALIRGLTALTAAAEEARTGINHSIAADLVDLAFVELNQMAESLSEALEPFADEPRTQRLQRFTRSAERLRTSLTKTEYATLVGAQLHDFDDAPRY